MAEMLYTKEHMWVCQDGDTTKVGLSSYALTKLKNIVFMSLPEVGDSFDVGDTLGDVESVKTVEDLISPVAGEVTAVHEELLNNPSAIGDTVDTGWLLTFTTTGEVAELLSESDYQKYVATL